MQIIQRLAAFFEKNCAIVEEFQMQRYKSGDAMITVHCSIDRNVYIDFEKIISEMDGIIELKLSGPRIHVDGT